MSTQIFRQLCSEAWREMGFGHDSWQPWSTMEDWQKAQWDAIMATAKSVFGRRSKHRAIHVKQSKLP